MMQLKKNTVWRDKADGFLSFVRHFCCSVFYINNNGMNAHCEFEEAKSLANQCFNINTTSSNTCNIGDNCGMHDEVAVTSISSYSKF